MEFTLEGEPIDARGRKPYLERFIHGAIYEARPDVMSVVHNHSQYDPVRYHRQKLRPLLHVRFDRA
jgi:HCOMODA/2-hydroxy-3-carboxy-muconic semialdehyde decarboxylase